MNIINLKKLIMKENLKTLSSSDKMTNEISALSLVESFLDEYYLFRRNVLSGKTEYFTLSKNEDETEEPVEEEPETGGERRNLLTLPGRC